jgi:hypothetical protein
MQADAPRRALTRARLPARACLSAGAHPQRARRGPGLADAAWAFQAGTEDWMASPQGWCLGEGRRRMTCWLPPRFRLQAGRLAVLLALGSACAPKRDATAPPGGFPEYTAEQAHLFDDTFAAAAFGVTAVASLQQQRDLEERAASAESATIMKVATVSQLGTGAGYEIGLRPLAAIAGPAEPAPVTLSLTSENPSWVFLSGVGMSWVGTELVFLAKRYQGPDGPVLRFHAEPKTPVVLATVAAARGKK